MLYTFQLSTLNSKKKNVYFNVINVTSPNFPARVRH